MSSQIAGTTPNSGRHSFRYHQLPDGIGDAENMNQLLHRPQFLSPTSPKRAHFDTPPPLSPHILTMQSIRTPTGAVQHQRLTISRKAIVNKLSHSTNSPLVHQHHPSTTSARVYGLRSGGNPGHMCAHGGVSTPLPGEETNHVTMVKGRPFHRLKSEIAQVISNTIVFDR